MLVLLVLLVGDIWIFEDIRWEECAVTSQVARQLIHNTRRVAPDSLGSPFILSLSLSLSVYTVVVALTIIIQYFKKKEKQKEKRVNLIK